MKLSKILMSGVLALTVASSAQASTYVVRIAGSSAFRKSTVESIQNLLQTGYTVAWADGSDQYGANASLFTGKLKTATSHVTTSDTVIIATSWTGSAAGVKCVGQSIPSSARGFLPTTAASGSNASSNITDTTSAPDIALSDVYVESTGFGTKTSLGLTEATSGPVGVCPFKWVVTGGTATTGITNVTPQLARNLFNSGEFSKMEFTGKATDASAVVVSTGRDADSGTRLTAFAETGVGTSTVVLQYALLDANGNMVYDATGTQWGFAPGNTINGVSYDDGNTGYSSGGNLVSALAYASLADGPVVTYLSKNDAAKAISNSNCGELSYNGVFYGSDDTKIQNGAYTFWSYEHLFYRTSDKTANPYRTEFAEALASNIKSTTAGDSGITISSMKVSRTSDGGLVAP